MENYLRCIAGKDQGTVFKLEEGKTYLAGRSVGCDFQLHDLHISRKHCAFRCEKEHTALQNLSKTNPTLVNGQPVKFNALKTGDRIGMGETILQYSDKPPTEKEKISISAPKASGTMAPKTTEVHKSAPAPAPAPGSAPVLNTGDGFKDYKVLSRIGRGNITTVYKVSDASGRALALKVFDCLGQEEGDWGEKFIGAVKAANKAKSPNLLKIISVGKAAGHYYVATEYVEGKNLRHIIEDTTVVSLEDVQGAMDHRQAVDIGIQVARALVAVRKAKVLHLNIKLENILVADGGNVKLADLGVSEMASDAAISLLGRRSDNPAHIHYIAPERLKPPGQADHRADIYALGAVLYAMLTGRPPFDGLWNLELLDPKNRPELTSPRRFNPSIPEELCQVIHRSMEFDPARRYQEPAEMLRDLELLREKLKA